MSAARPRPMTENTIVSWVNPRSGMASPLTSNETPRANASAAAPVVAAAATSAATSPGSQIERRWLVVSVGVDMVTSDFILRRPPRPSCQHHERQDAFTTGWRNFSARDLHEVRRRRRLDGHGGAPVAVGRDEVAVLVREDHLAQQVV